MLIFLTGAAGLLGGALAEELCSKGHSLIALVHREHEILGNRGAALPVREFEGSLPEPGQVSVLRGDVTRSDLGVDPETLNAVGAATDCVIHCAALVKFTAAFEELHRVNVLGAHNVARCFPRARFIHVSTAYTCGRMDGVIKEELHPRSGTFGNDYERSKAIAEHELLSILPSAIIVRPSIILGELSDGAIRSFDTIYRAFKFIAEGKIKQVPVDPVATLNFVPIDHVVNGIAVIAEAEKNTPAIIHLAARQAIPAVRFLELIGTMPGLQSPQVTAPSCEKRDPKGIAEQMIAPYLAYFKRSPQFDTLAMEQITGEPAPDMDEAAMLRQFRYCVDAGFIRTRLSCDADQRC